MNGATMVGRLSQQTFKQLELSHSLARVFSSLGGSKANGKGHQSAPLAI